ncbi:F0F1 ATP synthase subunit B [Rugosimonospora acidiphila]|uniref:ATP synthase subunit b n=1 Tax=Rugosimonospora acidiphila TaxID=556531 RepID=A0ABP9RQ69_9ACTN
MYVLAADTPNPVLPIWQELVLGLVAFGVLFFVLAKYVFPRMEDTFKARVDAIEGGIKRAEERQAEANALFEQYKQQLAEARTEAAKIRDRAHADANQIREDMLVQVREERDRILEAGQQQLDQHRAQIVRELRADVGNIAVDLASRIVGEALADEARQRGTVDRFLNDLETAS